MRPEPGRPDAFVGTHHDPYGSLWADDGYRSAGLCGTGPFQGLLPATAPPPCLLSAGGRAETDTGGNDATSGLWVPPPAGTASCCY